MTDFLPSLPAIDRGTTYRFGFFYIKDGEPYDISDCEVFFTVKKPEYDNVRDDASAVMKQTKTVHEEPENGYTLFELEPIETWIAPGQNTFMPGTRVRIYGM